jgi:hypothetical protein
LQWIITNRRYIEYPAEVAPGDNVLPSGDELRRAVEKEVREKDR